LLGEQQVRVPIGRPIDNTQIYILDKGLKPVPVGVAGEIYVGGAGMARGYLNQVELTRQRFIEVAFGEECKVRVYRSGDVGRYLSDGNIEYLGRTDQQVKVRGFRIELAEVEAALEREAGAEQAVVVAREEAGGGKRLVAYVKGKVTTRELRESARRALPEYMLPSQFVLVASFALLPGGKVDRSALPEPRQKQNESKQLAPRDVLESRMQSIWENVLGVRPIGISDDFFELGGHSLLAARLFARIEKELGVSVPLASLYQRPTVGQLADMIRHGSARPFTSLVPIQTEGTRPPLFLIHGAEGNVLLYRDLARHLGPGQPVYGLQSAGLIDGGCLHDSLERIAERYVREVISVFPEGPYYLGGYCFGGSVAYEMANQLREQGKEVRLVVLLETYCFRFGMKHLSWYYEVIRDLQNVFYHLQTFTALSTKGEWKFFRTKLSVEISRAKVMTSAFITWLASLLRLRIGLQYRHLAVTKANHSAALNYAPKAYTGRVVLFRPHRFFASLNDPKVEWGEFAIGDFAVHMIPVNPRSMLLEPFVQVLAEKLANCIENQ
jgi:thioesterase domain-containing protein/acyl carrier protein